MPLPYSATIQLLTSDYPRIARNGFILCDVFVFETCKTMHMAYCLHCRRIFSFSWTKKHSRRLRMTSVDVARFFKEDKVDLYRQDILSELELLFENGRFSRSSCSVERSVAFQRPNEDGDESLAVFNETVGFRLGQDVPPLEQDELDQPPGAQTDPLAEADQRFECFQECLLNSSFYGSEFDGQKFLCLAESMFNTGFSSSDDKTRNQVKAGIVTSFARKMCTLLSLTKSQNDQLLNFWKTMIVFISPSSEEVVKKVFASYNSCVRQSLRDGMEKKEQCQRFMETCSYFSIAIDSALIRNEHLFSCFSRFCFEDSVIQLPLFFDVCHGSTGNEIAHFVFTKLLEFNPTFEKLVSISTDGATNMIGRVSGLTTKLKQLIHQHCATRQMPFKDFHSVWCFAHRLNLVVKDVMDLKGMSIVKAFADWFTDRRRQTNYKAFLSQTNLDEKLRSIPQPSETRWLFYHDVISAILSQQPYVEDFVKGQPCFTQFWSSLNQKKEQFGMLVDRPFSFSDVNLSSLFLFAEYILKLLKRVNQIFQERYLMICDAWNLINSLKKNIFMITTSFDSPTSSLSFLSEIDRNKRDDFSSILQQLLRSLHLRFACPSSSFDMKRKMRSSNTDFGEATTLHNPFATQCSLSETIEKISICTAINMNNSLLGTEREMMDEVCRIIEETNQRQEEIRQLLYDKNRDMSEAVGFDVEIEMTFVEALQIVGREQYPLLWREIQKMKTVMATTVCCEQSFSVLKHSLHVNMNKETVIANITSKFHKRTEATQI